MVNKKPMQLSLPFDAKQGAKKIAVRKRFARMLIEVNDSLSKEKINMALRFAKEVHKNKFRKSGEPYINHPLRVASYALEYGCRPTVVVAALLHDVIEDGRIYYKDIEKKFGKRVAGIVINLTKPKLHGGRWIFANEQEYYKISDEYRIDLYHERSRVYYDHLINSGDLDAILVKLFDNLHNLKTLKYVGDDQKTRNSETIAKHSMLLASRLFDEKIVSFFKQKLSEINPDIDLESYLYLNHASYSDDVIVLPPRSNIGIDMFRKLPLPGKKRIVIYGNPEYAFLHNYVEIGVPKQCKNKIPLIKSMLVGFKVTVGRSLVPKNVDAHEIILRVSGFRDNFEKSVLRVTRDRIHLNLRNVVVSIPSSSIPRIRIYGDEFNDVKKKFAKLRTDLAKVYVKLVC